MKSGSPGEKGPGPFDQAAIQFFAGLMAERGLEELDLRDGDQSIRLRRSNPPPQARPAPGPATIVEIKAPTAGTFQASPATDAEPFVRVGTEVGPDTVVCHVTAEGERNEIVAGCTGTIAEVVAKSGQAVEHGQPLFCVALAGQYARPH